MTSLRLLSENRKRACDTSSISLSLSLPLTTLTSCPGRECSPWLRECHTPRTWECAEGLEGCRWPKDFSSTPRRTSLQWTFWWRSWPEHWPRVSTWRSWKVHQRLCSFPQSLLLKDTNTVVSRFRGLGPSPLKCPLNRDSPLNGIIQIYWKWIFNTYNQFRVKV